MPATLNQPAVTADSDLAGKSNAKPSMYACRAQLASGTFGAHEANSGMIAVLSQSNVCLSCLSRM